MKVFKFKSTFMNTYVIIIIDKNFCMVTTQNQQFQLSKLHFCLLSYMNWPASAVHICNYIHIHLLTANATAAE